MGGEILRSTNGGVNWGQLSNGNDMWFWDVKFSDANTGLAVGEYGTMFKTTNGGSNWNLIQFYHWDELTSISKVDVNNWFVGSFPEGKVFKTTNTGLTWDTLYTDLYGITRIDFVNSMTGFGVCKYNYFFKTTNGGLNWDIDTIRGPGQNWALDFIDENTGYAGGNKNYRTTNGGISWDSISFGFTLYSLDYQFLNGNTGFVAGIYEDEYPKGRILKTTNGGLNWQVKYTTRYYIMDVYFYNESLGFILCDNEVYKTTTGGENWFKIKTCSYNQHTSVYFPDSLNGYIVGSNLTIIKTTNGGGGPIGIEPISGKTPEAFVLHQNYPNPFNPMTKIRFDIPPSRGVRGVTPLSAVGGFGEGLGVRLIIYDVLGREIATLVNGQLKPGVYEVEWSAANYPSGVYFYQLRTEEYSETRKMVLIK
jgi:photosystem II stability/assembly factor-like uncharacterized protein